MRWIGSFVVALLVSACASSRESHSGAAGLALVGVSVVDVESGEVVSGQTVVIVGREIRAVASDGRIDLPMGTSVVNARGKFLIPGLWDTHVHVTPFGESVLPLFIAYGVTAVRDVGSTDTIFRWREEIAAGERLGRRIWTSGRMLAQARGADPGPEWERVDSPATARQAVAARRTAGADLLKMQDSFMERALWSAAVAEAALHGLPVAGHAPVNVPLTEAIKLGLRSIEHTLGLPLALSASEDRLRQRVMHAESDSARWTALYDADVEALATLDSTRLRDLAKLMRERGVALSPNLTDSRAMATAPTGRWDEDPRLATISPTVRELWRGMAAAGTPANTRNLQRLYQRIPAIVLALHRAGVTILAGTDAWAMYDFPGSDLHSDLWHLVPGKLADLVLLDANPLADIRTTERISAVVANGRYLDRPALDLLLADARRAATTLCPRAAPCAGIDEPEGVVCRFYQVYLETRPVGLPTPEQEQLLAPYLTTALLVLMDEARAYQAAFEAEHPDDKPPFVDGTLFTSLFEGADRFEVVRSEPTESGGAVVAVRFGYDDVEPWEDAVIVAREGDRYAIDDIVFSGVGPFNPAGRLTETLSWRE